MVVTELFRQSNYRLYSFVSFGVCESAESVNTEAVSPSESAPPCRVWVVPGGSCSAERVS